MSWSPRLARAEDAPALEALIERSVRVSLARHYTAAQLDAALGPVFGLDRQLIADGTYFVIEENGAPIACGGWSRRAAVYGGDRARVGADAPLDPARDAARVRAFFVDPAHERRGLGAALLAASEAAIRAAGFTRITLCATLAGEPLYARHGYAVVERHAAPLPGGGTIETVTMGREL